MKTVFSVVVLIVFGAIVYFLSLYLLNIAGLPGALLAGTPGKRSKFRFIIGTIVSALGQSYVYLAYTAFIVSWTIGAARRKDVISIFIWPFAFLAVLIPIWFTVTHANVEARELKSVSPQVNALFVTTIVSLFGFFVFAFVPIVMKVAWGWVPYVQYVIPAIK